MRAYLVVLMTLLVCGVMASLPSSTVASCDFGSGLASVNQMILCSHRTIIDDDDDDSDQDINMCDTCLPELRLNLESLNCVNESVFEPWLVYADDICDSDLLKGKKCDEPIEARECITRWLANTTETGVCHDRRFNESDGSHNTPQPTAIAAASSASECIQEHCWNNKQSRKGTGGVNRVFNAFFDNIEPFFCAQRSVECSALFRLPECSNFTTYESFDERIIPTDNECRCSITLEQCAFENVSATTFETFQEWKEDVFAMNDVECRSRMSAFPSPSPSSPSSDGISDQDGVKAGILFGSGGAGSTIGIGAVVAGSAMGIAALVISLLLVRRSSIHHTYHDDIESVDLPAATAAVVGVPPVPANSGISLSGGGGGGDHRSSGRRAPAAAAAV